MGQNGPKIDKKWAQTGQKTHFSLFCPLFFHFEKKNKNSEIYFSSFFWLETSHFHTMFGSRVMHFMSFWGKSVKK